MCHTASPFPAAAPKDDDELVRPAVDGTLRVLQACAAPGAVVRRVVLTSSIASVSSGYEKKKKAGRAAKDAAKEGAGSRHVNNNGLGHTGAPEAPWTEDDWSDAGSPSCGAYPKSKTLAERAAWAFVDRAAKARALALRDGTAHGGNTFELATINPGFIMGPPLAARGCTSARLPSALLGRKYPACPQLGFALVDVRTTARAHVRALSAPGAAGERFVLVAESLWMRGVAAHLAREFNPMGWRVPTGGLPYWVLWLASWTDKTVANLLSEVGKLPHYDNAKAARVLGVRHRPMRQTLVDMAHAMVALGMVERKAGYEAPAEDALSSSGGSVD